MPVSTLSASNALNPGADLWILPGVKECRYIQKIDWYLNFQITKSHLHQTHAIPSQVKSLLMECQIPEIYFSRDVQNIRMLESSSLFPNRWVVQIDSFSSVQTWCQQISEIWTQLRKPTLRVFLPTGLSAGDFQSHWKELQSFDDFTVVLD